MINLALVYSVSSFYSVTKEHVQMLNNLNWLSQKAIFLEASGDFAARGRVWEDFTRRKERFDHTYDKLTEIEATIQKLIFETREVFGKELHRSIKSLLFPVLKNSNDPDYCSLHRYHELSSQQIDSVGASLPHEIFKMQVVIQNDCDDKISELAALFR